MIRPVLSAVVFSSALLAGLAFVRIAGVFSPGEVPVPEPPESRGTVETSPFGAVEVNFLRGEYFDGEPVAVFEVANRGVETASYGNYSRIEAEMPEFALPKVRVGSSEKLMMYCGTGLVTHRLEPGRSGIARVGGRFLAEHWANGRPLRIGYTFGFGPDRVTETVWSAPLPINESIRRKLVNIKNDRQ